MSDPTFKEAVETVYRRAMCGAITPQKAGEDFRDVIGMALQLREIIVSQSTLRLLSYDEGAKISVIKALREVTGAGLKEAKVMSESLPIYVLVDVDPEDAARAAALLEDAGGAVEIK